MFGSWEAVNRFRHRLRAGFCIIAIGSLQLSSAQGSSTCPASPGQCPPEGCSTSNGPFAPYDPLLNRQKNHLDGPPVPQNPPFTVARMMDEAVLPVHRPHKKNGKDLRSEWKDTQAYQDISQLEHRQATVEGYIARVKAGGKESCNCDITSSAVVDTHVNVVDRPQDPNTDPATLAAVSVVAEVTWRVRRSHPDWTVSNLAKLQLGRNGARVRITGDLLYDNLHWDLKNSGHRGTLWEIHPIRSIQVLVNKRWVEYSLQPNALFQFVVTPHAVKRPDGRMATAPGLPLTDAWKPRWTPAQLQRLDAAFGDDRS